MPRVFQVLVAAALGGGCSCGVTVGSPPPPPPPAGSPVLYFSDLTSGPKTGLGDGLGEGAIVTVWGTNLGSSQGSSRIFAGGAEAAHIYYWGNADGSPGAGPADLYTFHRMQAIAFSVSSAATDGPGTIHATVGGVDSNALPFTVRAGAIFHVQVGGTDAVVAPAGSWNQPWATLEFVVTGAGTAPGRGDGQLAPGAIVYAGDGVTEINGVVGSLNSFGLANFFLDGTADAPFSIVAYPGATVRIEGDNGGIAYARAYWAFAKLIVRAGLVPYTSGPGAQGAIDYVGVGGRIVANDVAGRPGSCANGQSGCIAASAGFASALRLLGNAIHDWGCDSTDKLEHVVYMTNRSGSPLEAYELGWNYLHDNKAHHGFNNYDEGSCGDFTGTVRIHDNVVVNQVGVAVGVGSGGVDPCYTMPVEIFNNLFIDAGLETANCMTLSDSCWHNYAVSFSGATNHAHVRFYDNTIVGYGLGYPPLSPPGFAASIDAAMPGQVEWFDNLVVDTHDEEYWKPTGSRPPDSFGGDLWYNGGDSTPAAPPSWDTGALSTNPLFLDPANGVFWLGAGSPAVDTGSAMVGSVVTTDLLGTARPQGAGWDIGAFEYVP